MRSFEDFITDTCDCLETFVGINKMSHRDFGKWVYDCAIETEITRLKAELERAEEVIRDFRDFGTRHDQNPTGQFKQCGCFDSFASDNWQDYIRSQDKSVRERSREYFKNKENL